MTTPTAVLAFSGGMDSTTLAAHYARTHRLVLLSVDYGQRHRRELDAARQVAGLLGADEHHVIDLRHLGPLLAGSALTDPSVTVPDGHYEDETMRATVVPNRNAILANIAVGAAAARGAEVVALGIHAGDHTIYPDCRPEFLDALRDCVRVALAGLPIPDVEAPFLTWTKDRIAQYARDIDAPLHASWSCYKGGTVHCGTCGTCVERAEAFTLAGVPDPTEYLTPPPLVESTAAARR
ncbi:7-cyano-7-deazaguanine synthase QueC [Kutzneria viridogrisea]|uniref:7-cyano-7-deazaguanine synthase n=1 Tax=Kutzneria viridogrisea TaxID=47990 RepID=A0ABR6BGV5_9PSEU|nr:7-cyano-7-deazaguanine synthase [Kutzneria viridogrisea]